MNKPIYYRNNIDLQTTYPHENAHQHEIDAHSLWILEGDDTLVLVNDDFYYHTQLNNTLFYKTEIQD